MPRGRPSRTPAGRSGAQDVRGRHGHRSRRSRTRWETRRAFPVVADAGRRVAQAGVRAPAGAPCGHRAGFRAAAAAGYDAPGPSRTTEPRRRPCPGTPRGIQGRRGGGASVGRERCRGMTPLPPMRTGPPGPRRRHEDGHGADPAVRPWSRGPWIPARPNGPPRSWCLGVLSQQAGKGPALAGLWSIKSGSVPDRGARPAGGRGGPVGATPVIEHVWLHSPDCNREVQALP